MTHCNTPEIRCTSFRVPYFICIGPAPGSRKKICFNRFSITEYYHPPGSIHRLTACRLFGNVVIHLTGNSIVHIRTPLFHSFFSDLPYCICSCANCLCTECFCRGIRRHLTRHNSFQIRFQINLVDHSKTLFLSRHFQNTLICRRALTSSDRIQSQ